MDIKKELIKISSDSSSIDKLIESVELKKHELSKKSHLLRVIALGNTIEELNKTNLFKDEQVKFLEVCLDKEPPIADLKLTFCILDKNKNRMRVIDENNIFVPVFSTLMVQTYKLGLINQMFINEDALTSLKADRIIELKPGIKDVLLNILLSDELRKILEYNKMQIELPSNNGLSSKKLKA